MYTMNPKPYDVFDILSKIKTLFFLSVFVLAVSCVTNDKEDNKFLLLPQKQGSTICEMEKSKKLNNFLLSGYKYKIDFLDLSNDSINIFPDLSSYTINRLDISQNLIDTLDWKKLPKELHTLNISNNRLKELYLGNLKIGLYHREAEPTTVINLYCSNNQINNLVIVGYPDTVLVNNNKLYNLRIYRTMRKMKFLNISNNKRCVYYPGVEMAESFRADSIKRIAETWEMPWEHR